MTDEDQEVLDHFSCGNDELDSFLREDTIAREKEGLLRTYLAFDGSALLGYASILADVLRLDPDEGDRSGIATTKYPIPAIKVARLGVTKDRQRGGGVGTLLMNFALSRLFAVSEAAGCRFLVVDAKIATDAERFYMRLGFERNLSKHQTRNKQAVSMRFDPFVEGAPTWVNDAGEVVV